MVSMAQSIQPGDIRTRKEIVPVLGGSLYGGICPGNDEKTVVLYSDERAGAEFGYRDGWVPADEEDQVPGGQIFEYTGAGKVGDQTLEGPKGWTNGAVLNHAQAGRALHLFIAAGKVPGTDTTRQRYVGQFELNKRLAFTVRTALDQELKMRRVIVFRLQPVGDVEFNPSDQVSPPPATRVELVPASVTASKLVTPESNKTPRPCFRTLLYSVGAGAWILVACREGACRMRNGPCCSRCCRYRRLGVPLGLSAS